ncbi:hypothetical protein L484_025788 [Morus notabilis]|uniref:Embryo-specific protein ATS3B n=1 Tax=Morus notabilis TaxID=981085 RepID=W9REH6_9ROSA|nr:embryo-specific protein ATS3A [Morus notabilis]EXB67306.1 hypothetical protein L484_025788 [Morus notabilis]
MIKSLTFLALFFTFSVSESASILPHPKPLNSSIPKTISQNTGSCSYTVIIKTSCSSSKYTRDHIGLYFGDSYGIQVYAPRLDDPRSGTFERCSSDTFHINGPCTHQICSLYLYRSGYDGWKPDTVKVYGYYTKAVTFYFNTFIPNGIWYGFNDCYGGLASSD